MLLAIDTSTAYTGVACMADGIILAECTWRSGRDHTAQLLPQIAQLFQHLGCTLEDLSAVAVALGPGSWGGLRVGASTAKGLVLALNIPIIGIGTLDVIAYQCGSHQQPIAPVIRLGRGRVGTAGPGRFDPTRKPLQARNLDLDQLCAEISEPTLVCGEIDDATRGTLVERLGGLASFPPATEAIRRPGYLADLAWRRLRAGRTDNPATLEPIYLGQPVKS
jgi:tRNA threonylcarbamoyladenosine biosynthesis protein TsaB